MASELNLNPVYIINPFAVAPLKRLVLVDFSWLLHRSFHTFGNLSADIGGVQVPTGDIFGVTRTVGNLCAAFPDSAIVLCADMRSERGAMNSEYKANRDSEKSSEVYSKINDILNAASVNPAVYIAIAQGKEADDHIFSLAQHFAEIGLEIVVYTADRDLLQSITSEKIRVLVDYKAPSTHSGGEHQFTWKDAQTVIQEYGVPPHKLPFYRAFKGDASDNLSGYTRFPTTLAVELANNFDSPKDMLSNPEKARSFATTPAQLVRVNEVLASPSKLISNYSIMRLSKMPDLYLFESDRSHRSLLERYQLSWYTNFLAKYGI
jgi:DNA polymerase-1